MGFGWVGFAVKLTNQNKEANPTHGAEALVDGATRNKKKTIGDKRTGRLYRACNIVSRSFSVVSQKFVWVSLPLLRAFG